MAAKLTNLGALDKHMKTASYVDGHLPTQADISVFKAISPPPASLPHADRWYKHIASFSPAKVAALPGVFETLAASASAPKQEPKEKKEKAPKEPKEKKEKKEKPAKEAKEAPKKEAPKKEEKAAPSEADKEKKAAEKKLAKVIKEGGKKGVEIEGARDMAGLDFFCTTMDEPDGDLDLLLTAMKAANAEPEEGSEERKGCSGPIGKMFFSAGAKQLAMVAYVPSGDVGKVEAGKVNSQPWMEAVIGHAEFAGRGKVVAAAAPAESPSGGEVVTAVVASDADAGKFALKDKDVAMAAAQTFLRERGAFPEDTGDSDDDEVAFGDDAFDEINGW